ncbi:autotransporter domain-containing protein [Stakelama tenebrarum]|uniref:Autotransporter domain-containing protein n=1 Tax=Stakelama tenebrarum TaxID=2711215 RepID=A0A6G6Y4V6_9SPHN|nr:autotransporter domain-containing protein [Sphingosinithalassobacter tenebrarum]QIG79606.1 autotransporter domain-containing protein [Sphingosinithalassobacter tenebrarum]
MIQYGSTTIAQRSRKKVLLASAAGLALVTGATAAQAQDGPAFAEDIAQGAGPQFVQDIAQGAGAEFAEDVPHAAGPRRAPIAEDIPQVVVQGPGEGYDVNPGAEGSIYDDAVDVTGVGQFYRADGYVCTGTLINPRTVLFAAHCVNDIPEEQYGAATGGLPAAFSFRADAVPGLIDWINAGYNSVADSYVYNVNEIVWNEESVARPEGLGFLEGDVAIATLDTPAANVPTWALLFSPLPAPEEIDSANGTGYHVVHNGYGVTGYGNGPIAAGVDFYRRAAENMIGILGSLNDRNDFLFGPGGDDLPQNLYQMDFDDPTRENPYDFNLFRDDAQDPEGTTAGGDSGGPLILDQTFDQEVVIGVLSGGSRFYGAQPFSTYGTSSFYQPLYLFWDWIAANSAYRYATNVEGDGNWADADHWVSALDPNFMIIEDGGLVNGLPDNPGAGAFGEDDAQEFGQVCFNTECYDLATGEYVVYDDAGGATREGSGGNNPADGDTEISGIARVDGLIAEDRATAGGQGTGGSQGTAALPPATIENGLPGATGFTPDNITPDPVAGVRARYYDVTLAAAGTTTLDTDVVIDNFTMVGAETALDVTSEGTLWSHMGFLHTLGTMTVDGAIGSYSNYSLIAGGLMGSGDIYVPYFINVGGAIAPGSLTETGTLSLHGNAILASASTYYVNLGASGTSDLLSVNATAYDTDDAPLNGMASIGGGVLFSPTEGTMVRDGYTYTILTAEGGISGTFDQANALSAILSPVFTYSDNAVMVEIEAGDYADVIDASSPVQSAFATLLDGNRDNYGAFSDLFGPLDLLDGPSIQSLFESWAPRNPTMNGAMAMSTLETTAGLVGQRISAFSPGAGTETMASLPYAGNPMGTVMTMTSPYAGDSIGSGVQMEDRALSSTASVYLAGGYIDGESTGMITAAPMGNDSFDGWYATAGVEAMVGDSAMIGFALTYADVEGDVYGAPQSTSSTLYQGTLYGVGYFGGVKVDTMLSAGLLDTDSTRTASLGGTSYTLRASDNPLTITSQLGVSVPLTYGAFSVTPRGSLRVMHIGYTPTAERGGPMALQYDMGDFNSVQGRLGATLQGTGTFRPFLTANYVHDFDERPAAFAANFVGSVSPSVSFALNGTDQDWGEVSGGIAYDTPTVRVAISANTTFERSDIENRSYQGSVTVRF